MNCLPIPIQTLVYRYLHATYLNEGFNSIFPLTNSSEPFSVEKFALLNAHLSKIERLVEFKSDKCKMCFERNGFGERSLETWIRCHEILHNLDNFFFVNGSLYYSINTVRDGKIITVLSPVISRAKIDPSKMSVYQQVFKLYEYTLTNPSDEYLESYIPPYNCN